MLTLAGIDDHEAPRLGARAREVRLARALGELAALGLEAIRDARRQVALAGARAAHIDRRVEQEREIRSQLALHERLEMRYVRGRDAPPAALIGIGSVGEAVAKHPRAAIERRTDDIFDVRA